jgi:hypothetical protein
MSASIASPQAKFSKILFQMGSLTDLGPMVEGFALFSRASQFIFQFVCYNRHGRDSNGVLTFVLHCCSPVSFHSDECDLLIERMKGIP